MQEQQTTSTTSPSPLNSPSAQANFHAYTSCQCFVIIVGAIFLLLLTGGVASAIGETTVASEIEPSQDVPGKDCESLVLETWTMFSMHKTSPPIGTIATLATIRTLAQIGTLAPIKACGKYLLRPLVLREEPKVLTLKFSGSLSLRAMTRPAP